MQFIKNNLSIILFIIPICISVFFLFWKINSIPFGLNNDAAWEGSAAIEILNGNYAPYIPYAAEGWRGEGIVRLIVAFFMLFFGYEAITIRLSTVFFGLGLVAVSFILVKKLFDEKLAFLTSFFIAISGWQITFSKTGWRAVTVPFFTTLLFYFYFKGKETKSFFNFAASGALLSFVTFYTYDAARAVPLLLTIWIFIEILTSKSYLKTFYRQLSVLIFSAFLIALPMLVYAYGNFDNFTSRSNFLYVGNQIKIEGNYSPLINNFKKSALLFNVSANGNDYFIFEPLIDPPLAWLLPLGLFISVLIMFKKRNKNILFMIIWLIISLIPGLLSVPNGNRAIGAIPSVFFFCAVGLYYPSIFIYDKLKKYKINNIVIILIAVFCIISTYITYDNYIGENRRELRGFYPETKITTDYIKTIWDDYEIHLIDNYPRELLTFYLYREGKNAFTKNYYWHEYSYELLNISLEHNKGIAFFMFDNPQNRPIVNQLLSKYPDAKKHNLWYINDNIKRPAAIVILVSE